MNLGVELASRKGGLLLKNPILTASGTFSFGLDEQHVFDIHRLGGIVTKTVTLEPRPGSMQTRTAETPSGMLNAIGLQNPGVDRLIRDLAPRWASWQTPVVVSILGASIDEYREVARRLDGVEGVDALEVNISSPNAKRGGMEFGQDSQTAAEVTTAVVEATTLPVVLKLTPNVSDIVTIAQAVADAGADAICLINTLQAMAIDARSRTPALGSIYGGLSGPAIKPVALRMVHQVYRKVQLPIIGCGGIVTGIDAVEFLMAGATAVEVGTATFANPAAPIDVLDGLEAFMREEHVEEIGSIVGAVHRTRPKVP
jgi:dihydroorotate dehydrogenase (NAD+) catalytic subunit